jgi:hypothetical protein
MLPVVTTPATGGADRVPERRSDGRRQTRRLKVVRQAEMVDIACPAHGGR